MSLLKLSAARNRVFSFVGVSLTSLSVTISKDGAAFGAIAGTLSNITGNYYKLALAAGDTDTAGDLAYKFSDTVLGVVVPNGEDVDQVVANVPGDPATKVTLADGVAHGGTLGSSTATLALSRINVTSQTADTPAIKAIGNGTGAAVQIGDGANGAEGLKVLGGTNAVPAVKIGDGSTGAGGILVLASGSNVGVQIGDGSSGGIGLEVLGANALPSIKIGTGTDGGAGIDVRGANNNAAVQIGDNSGTGRWGLRILGNDTYPAVFLQGGGSAIVAEVDNGLGVDSPGILVTTGIGVGSAVKLGDGSSGGAGLEILGNAGFSGIVSMGGAGGYGLSASLSPTTLASYFLTDSGTTYASAVAGSVVKEIATNAGGSGSAWDDVRASHTTPGTFGEYVNAALADGVAHGGTLGSSTATLALRAIDVTRGVGTAVTFSSSGGNGLDISGSSAGVSVAGGAGPGVRVATGGSNPTVQLGQGSIGGIGLLIMGGSGASGNAAGMGVVGYGSSAGISVQGGSSGSGMLLGSDSSGGTGLEVKAPAGIPAISAITSGGFAGSVKIGDSSIGSATGLDVQGVSTGASFYGAVADAINIHGASRGINIQSDAGDGIHIDTTDGHGININTALNFSLGTAGINIVGAGTGAGVAITGDNGFGLAIGSNNTTAVAVSAPAGTGIGVQALNNAVDLSSTGGGYGFDATLSPATLASYFLTDSGTTYPSAVAGSVVKEILGTGSITDASFSVPSDGTGQATGMLSMLLWLYHRFFGKVKYDKIGNSLITYQADGTTPRTTQVTTSNVLFDEIDAAP